MKKLFALILCAVSLFVFCAAGTARALRKLPVVGAYIT